MNNLDLILSKAKAKNAMKEMSLEEIIKTGDKIVANSEKKVEKNINKKNN